MEPENEAAIKALEKDKDRMIRHYLKLQDRVDSVNRDIYDVCCGIEVLNARISEAKARHDLHSRSKPTNGKAHPLNSKSHR